MTKTTASGDDMKNGDRIIKLNVGGESFCTSYATLKTSDFFKDLLNGDMNINYVNGNEIFIDRSGYQFKYIMMYLRCYDPRFNENRDLVGLKNEAEFYQLQDLVDTINNVLKKPPCRKELKLIDVEKLAEAKTWGLSADDSVIKPMSEPLEIISVIKVKEVTWSCCYHGSLDRCPVKCSIQKQIANNVVPSTKLLVAKK